MWKWRSDADLAEGVPHTRLIMPFLMPTRTESAVYFEQTLDVRDTQRFLDAANARDPELHATIFHVVAWAAARLLHERPRLNRFVTGNRLWQRRGIWISYSAKKRFSDDAPVVVLKREFDPAQSFEETVRAMQSGVREGKSDKRSYVDKELSAALAVPGLLLRWFLRLGRWADRLGVLPASVVDADPLYSSVFLANLGSLGMDAAYHHLFEYGNCPIFCVIGKVDDRVVVEDGKPVVRPTVVLRYSYDERIEDGLYAQRSLLQLKQYIEHPAGLAASPQDAPRHSFAPVSAAST